VFSQGIVEPAHLPAGSGGKPFQFGLGQTDPSAEFGLAALLVQTKQPSENQVSRSSTFDDLAPMRRNVNWGIK